MLGSIVLGSIAGTQLHSFWVGLGVWFGLAIYGSAFLVAQNKGETS
ncbi:MAG: hypothetical protein HZB70_01145 [Candidatus Berkelbacteria bacterium]|nr:MAG: hypothetical protein HZB70_01145 [Candidatus Berkelbacteria bacterium]QQG52055.1 MAG: hypothetical protein HY845_01850 [Candidatus Berkelbacteria bacterium]